MNMKIKSVLTFGVLASFLVAVFAFTKIQHIDEPNPEKEAILVRTILNGLKQWHFKPQEVDNDFSEKVFDLYLDNIDHGKRFFVKSEYEELKQWRLEIDDQAEAGTFAFFDRATELLNAAVDKTEKFYKSALEKELNINDGGTIETDGDKLDWVSSDAELKKRWEDLMEYEIINHIVRETNKQAKEDFKGEKKDKAVLEIEGREKTMEKYDRWFKRMRKSTRAKQMEVYLNAMTNVFDPHTGYYSPRDKKEFDIQMSGKLEGIGARLQSDGQKTTVTEIVVGGPAWKQGDLKAKDIITKVAQDGEEPVSVMGLEIDEVVDKIRGKKGTIVFLTVEKPDGLEEVIRIERDVVIMEEGFAKSLLLDLKKDGGEKIGYIYLPKFYADFTPQGTTSCAADVEKEINKLKEENVTGIILDLRGNSGGSLRDVIKMSGFFIEKGPIVQVKSRGTRPEVGADRDSRVQYTGPLVVMVNQFSASASEILAAAMQDYKRAVVVGATASYGKGTVQRFINLDDYSRASAENKPLGSMKITLQKFYRITGKTTQIDGVTPDIVLPDSYNGLEIGEKENDYPLASTTIDPVEYEQSTYQVRNLSDLKTKSKARVSENSTFKMIEDNSVRLKTQRERSEFPLNYDAFADFNKKQKEEGDKFENMLKPIEGFGIDNLSSDLQHIQSDTSRSARNDAWIEERQKDIQLYEAVHIIHDMIENDGMATKN